MPSTNENVVPLVIFFHKVLQIKHLTIINIDNSCGNVIVDGMQDANKICTPDLDIQQIPVGNDPVSVHVAIATLKCTEHRFALALGANLHNAIMVKAHKNNMADNSMQNWFCGNSFGGPDGCALEMASPLHLAHQCV